MVVNRRIGQRLKGGKIMRKIFILILLIFLLMGCSNVSHNNNSNSNVSHNNNSNSNTSHNNDSNSNVSHNNDSKNDEIIEDIYIGEIEWCGIDWNQIEFPINLNEDVLKEIKPINTKQMAVDIGKKIIDHFHRDGKMPEYTLISIIHSTEDDIWRFDYSIDQRNVDIDKLIDCGGLNVAIDGKKGTLIKAWVEE